MSKKNSVSDFFDFMSNNGLVSNLLCSLVVVLIPILFKNSLVRWLGETGAIIAGLMFVIAVFGVGYILWRYVCREKNAAKLCDFELLTDKTHDLNTFVDVDEDSSPTAPRRGLKNEISKWCSPVKDAVSSVGTSHVCVVSGERNLGRETLACAGAWTSAMSKGAKKKTRVYRCHKTFHEEAHSSSPEVSTWKKGVDEWLNALVKTTHYLVIFPDVPRGAWLDAIREASLSADKKSKHVFFLVKLLPGTSISSSDNSVRGMTGTTQWHIEPLTAVQCGEFIRTYAHKKGADDRLKELLQMCKTHSDTGDCDRWFYACSGGRPERLVKFFEHDGGRSMDDVLLRFKDDLMAAGVKDLCRHQEELAFLWCLCLERLVAARSGENGSIDIKRIADRMQRPLKEVVGVSQTVLRQQLSVVMSVAKLNDFFAKAAVRISDEMLVASLGHGAEEMDFQSGIAVWLRAVIEEGGVEQYLDIIAGAIANALLCSGAYAGAKGSVKIAFDAIEGLERSVALDKDCAHKFFSHLRNVLQDRILAVCYEGLGFLEDETVVAITSEVLEACGDDEESFLKYYRSALPIFGLCICNPMALNAVRRIRKIWWRCQSDEAASIFPTASLPEFLGTLLLCVFRSPNMNSADQAELFDSDDCFRSLLDKLGHRNCKEVEMWRQLIGAVGEDDVWKMSSAMSSILDAVGSASQWSGVFVLFAVVAVYMNDQCGDVKAFLWPRLIKALEICRVPNDEGKRAAEMARFPVLWRRAYYRYVSRECSPWVITTQIDDAKQALSGLDSLTPVEVLRYMPELVRHFSLCVQAKSRGDAKYAEVLKDGWLKIQAIAERADWFNVINRRARYWVVYWSGQIVRDAMTKAEQGTYFSRLSLLCEEIAETSDPWYHVMLILTCARLFDDAQSLRKVLMPVEDLIFNRYPKWLPVIDLRNVYESWYACAFKWFDDYLGNLPEKRQPADVMAIFLGVVSRRKLSAVDEMLNACIDIYADSKHSESSFAHLGLIDEALGHYAVDFHNRLCDGRCDQDCYAFAEAIGTSEQMQKSITEELKRAIADDDLDGCSWLCKVCFEIYAYIATPEELRCQSMSELFSSTLDAIRLLRANDWREPLLIGGIELLRTKLSGDLAERFSKIFQLLIDDNVKIVQDSIPNGVIEAVDEDSWLQDIWACPPAVLQHVPSQTAVKIFDRLNQIPSIYTAEWMEVLAADWFSAVYNVFMNLATADCCDGLFAAIEQMVFKRDFQRLCIDLQCSNWRVMDFLWRLAEERKRRDGSVTSVLRQQYRSVWSEVRQSIFATTTFEDLSEKDRNAVNKLDRELL